MKTTSGAMPQNVVKYVSVGVNMVNIVLLMCNICFGVLFWIYEADVLFYYNCLNFIALLIAWEMLRRKKKWVYTITIFAGLFMFMILAVIYLGWDYGFQQYCIGFIASLMFTEFYMHREKKVTKRTIIIVMSVLVLFVGLRLWTYEHPYVYKIDNIILVRGFYLLNSIIGFLFMIMYSYIYSSTVRKLEYALLEMANIDSLTGICNRRKMQQMLKTAIEGCKDGQGEMVIAMLDVDFFKKINDTYGHDAGDEVLATLGQILLSKHEKDDNFYVGRWGGEEFLVFCEIQSKPKADIVKEFDDLRQQIQDTVIESKNNKIKITVTIGLAFYKEDATIESMVREADDNLYLGKNSGRNKVVS